MVFKLNISDKGKAWKIESESESLVGKKIGEKFDGKEISPDLEGYQLEITGATDFSGFPHKSDIEGPELKRVLLTKGWGMHKKPKKEGKKKVSTPNGLRYRKTVRGNQISEKTTQINIKVIQDGSKKLKEIFPEQNKEPEAPVQEAPTQTTEKTESQENKVEQEVKAEIKEEVKESIPESKETNTEEKKEEAAEKIAEEVIEETKEAIDSAAQ